MQQAIKTLADQLEQAIRRALAETAYRPLVLGLAGAQGSGKSTLATALHGRLTESGVATAVLSLDDLYLTRAERERLAREVHPLLRTRGVPGTHDIALGLRTLSALERGEAVALPRFDKARDDRAPHAEWGCAAADTQVLLFEGWCVGARPQAAADLVQPVNALERDEDRQGLWRRYVNDALAGDYRRLFARIDVSVFLAAPDFATVFGWRKQQEDSLRARVGASAPGVMSDAALTRFIQHYERLTRFMLADMPPRADVLVKLAADRSVTEMALRL